MAAHVQMKPQFSSPQQIAGIGEHIYQGMQSELEKTSFGKFVAIDVINGQHCVSDTPEGSLEGAKASNPSGKYHLIRVGFSGAFQIGYVHHKSVLTGFLDNTGHPRINLKVRGIIAELAQEFEVMRLCNQILVTKIPEQRLAKSTLPLEPEL